MRQIWKGRLIVVFSRTDLQEQSSFKEFTKAFSDVDILILNDIYPASEEPIAGISSAVLCKAIKKAGHPHVEYIPKTEDIIEYLLKTVKQKDTVALSCGSIYKIGETFIRRLVARKTNK